MTLRLTTAQSDRASGALLAMAAGDALGAGDEFGPPLDDDVEVRMAGGGSSFDRRFAIRTGVQVGARVRGRCAYEDPWPRRDCSSGFELRIRRDLEG